jgi:hypothetical protein
MIYALLNILKRRVRRLVLRRKHLHRNQSSGDPGSIDLSLSVDLLSAAKIQLNGHDRFMVRPQTYFRLVQPWQCHTRIPTSFVYLYSFALRPEEYQPSSTCNFSRIDNAQLLIDLTNTANIPNYASWPTLAGPTYNDGNIMIYATNYNVLRVMSGMGGLNKKARKVTQYKYVDTTCMKMIEIPQNHMILSSC